CQSQMKERELTVAEVKNFVKNNSKPKKLVSAKEVIKTVAEFYLKVKASGDIYKGKYKGLYCVGCESFKNSSDLVDGKCPLHPNKEPEKIEEENYFFRWSKYRDFLVKHIKNNPDFIKPDSQRKNMLGFLKDGLDDLVITRPITRVSWGIPVPDDNNFVIYVWFDALINYISGAPDFWPADVHILGKDNTRWHALLWPAMLKSAGYELPKTIYSHGFVNINGQKISKSLGNVIRPTELVEKFSADAVRYYFLRHGPAIEDVDFSLEKLKGVYNADLANGLGNLVSRVAKLCQTNNFQFSISPTSPRLRGTGNFQLSTQIIEHLDKFEFDKAMGIIWAEITETDKKINIEKPWEIKDGQISEILQNYVTAIRQIATDLQPFLPETARKILDQFGGKSVKSGQPLFPRLPAQAGLK
ncbi:MAG: methionine--tRNA ligase, partial [Candidatus Microgenomates bacterium]